MVFSVKLKMHFACRVEIDSSTPSQLVLSRVSFGFLGAKKNAARAGDANCCISKMTWSDTGCAGLTCENNRLRLILWSVLIMRRLEKRRKKSRRNVDTKFGCMTVSNHMCDASRGSHLKCGLRGRAKIKMKALFWADGCLIDLRWPLSYDSYLVIVKRAGGKPVTFTLLPSSAISSKLSPWFIADHRSFTPTAEDSTVLPRSSSSVAEKNHLQAVIVSQPMPSSQNALHSYRNTDWQSHLSLWGGESELASKITLVVAQKSVWMFSAGGEVAPADESFLNGSSCNRHPRPNAVQ